MRLRRTVKIKKRDGRVDRSGDDAVANHLGDDDDDEDDDAVHKLR